ncbi:MAG: DUF2381 family protein [Myxococcaceae bacterium]|nr:DUF2381 family protein [Myxococcaceae bacterium]
MLPGLERGIPVPRDIPEEHSSAQRQRLVTVIGNPVDPLPEIRVSADTPTLFLFPAPILKKALAVLVGGGGRRLTTPKPRTPELYDRMPWPGSIRMMLRAELLVLRDALPHSGTLRSASPSERAGRLWSGPALTHSPPLD